VCVCVCVCVCVNTYVSTHKCMYVGMDACMHACVLVVTHLVQADEIRGNERGFEDCNTVGLEHGPHTHPIAQ
jgi:hypothetical protein